MIPRRRIEIGAFDLFGIAAAPLLAGRGHRDVRAFEEAVAAYLGCRHARTAGSGRDALRIVLGALGLKPGDEIMVPAYTLGELVPLLRRDGYRLVAADVDRESYNVTPDSVARALTPNTRAILALHAFGAPCDIEGIGELARSRAIPVVEDCAHALGAEVRGRKVGRFGAAAFFSLEVNKPVASFGGGIVTTDDPVLAARIDEIVDALPASEWPAIGKAMLKTVEEFAVRSPLYAVASRFLFSDRRSGVFDRCYRRLHDRVRAEIAYSGFQARMALRRLRGLDARNARLNAAWDELRRGLDGTPLLPQRRDRFGSPAFYNFAAAFAGEPSGFRRAAWRRGLDIAIRGEVLDDAAALLGQDGCPNAAALFASVVLLPLHDGVAPARLAGMAQRLGAPNR